MKNKIYLLILFITIGFTSCRKDQNIEVPSNVQKNEIFPDVASLNRSDILPEALEYYQNIASMAKWYAKHPDIRRENHLKKQTTAGDSVNTLLQKLEDIIIVDSGNVRKTIFELSDAKRDSFLNTYTLLEANLLSKKFKMIPSDNASAGIINNNKAFKKVFSDRKSLSVYSEDPYWIVRQNIQAQEDEQARVQPQAPFLKATMDTDDWFWAEVVSNGLLSESIFRGYPNVLSAQTFINRIRSSVKAGRFLIALPGGTNTTSPIVYYPNKNWYDVGHVAIMDRNDVPNTIDGSFNLTIGTDSKLGMHRENLANDEWTSLHGLSYVGRAFKVVWVWHYYNWHHFGYFPETRFYEDKVYNNVLSTLNTSYCHWWEVLYAKDVAPSRFICSSSAWWCAKKAGVNIGDWWKPTIFPAGIYLSNNVQIIDNTLY